MEQVSLQGEVELLETGQQLGFWFPLSQTALLAPHSDSPLPPSIPLNLLKLGRGGVISFDVIT